MWTKAQRTAAFKDPQLVRDGDRLYLAVTADFGRWPDETLLSTLYQRIRTEGDMPMRWWHGTKLAADHSFEERARATVALAEWRSALKGSPL